MSTNKLHTVYVLLTSEYAEVYRPVPAERVGEAIYKLGGYDLFVDDDEDWQFLPGATVKVVEKVFSDGEKGLLAHSLCER